WYIAGDFTLVGNRERYRVAHLAANGEILPFSPRVEGGEVRTIALVGDTLYLGGDFTHVNGIERNRLAAVKTDGTLLPWNPSANGTVYALAVSGSTVYVGGEFTSISSTSRNRLAAIGTDGTLLSWNPNANFEVNALAILGSTIYVGGWFTTVSSTTRNYLAAISIDNTCLNAYSPGPCLLAWNPNANAVVNAIAVSGNEIYVGGEFTQIGCPTGCTITGGPYTRNRLAVIGTNGTTLFNWNPDANSAVHALAILGSTIYVGGFFTSVSSTPRNYLAAISIANTCLTTYSPICLLSWSPGANNLVYTLATSSTNAVYAGGLFSIIGSLSRNRLAAIRTDGTILSWNPAANLPVNALAIAGSTVILGGNFSNINTTSRNYLAAIGTDGTLLPWNPNASGGVVNSLVVSGNTVYVGGGFTSIGSTSRNYLAAISIDNTCLATYSSSCLLSWNPNANYAVKALAVSGNIVYAGGDFTTIGGNPRNYLAAMGTDGTLLPWNPNAGGGAVNSLVVSGNTVYVGGWFTSISSTSRNYLAAISIDNTCLATYSSSCLLSWNPNPNNAVGTLAFSGNTVYAGGYFTNIGGANREYLAAISTNSILLPWNPNPGGGLVSIIVASGKTLYLGGNFTSLGSYTAERIASVNSDGSRNW
ncbi:MAG: WD40 repeat domain-containing protein, partial [Leptospiraceae bacterium]|nr:WD40 repeat domain-containing protein [Leptospiraceae bacterium]